MKQQPKSAREKKVEKVATLSEKLANAKTIVFADYHGLSANQIAQLRAKVKDAGGELIISKNTLTARALTSYQLPVTSYQLSGPTATLFAFEDEIAPIKTLADSAKTTGFPKFKFGFFGKDFLDAAAVEELAKIPPRNVLEARVVGALSSPIYGIVSVLGANIRNLIYVLDQASKKAL